MPGPKININSRTNWLSRNGVLDYADARLDQYVLETSDATFNSLTTTVGAIFGKDVNILGNLTVNQNLTVTGSTTIIGTDITEFKDNILLLNSEESGAGVTPNLSGIEVDRGSLINYQSVFEESTQLFKIGRVSSLQAVATREDVPLNYGFMIYNPTQGRLDSTQTFSLRATFNAGIESTSISTGTVIIDKGLGVSGNASVGGSVFLKGLGSNYSNYIKSNTSNDFIANVGNDFSFQINSGNSIKVPQDALLKFGTYSTLSSDNNKLYISNTVGDINFVTSSNGKLQVLSGTFLQWGATGTENIRYNGTDIVLNSSGNFSVSPKAIFTNATASTNSVTASVTFVGGISTANSTDASSSSVGGGYTGAGGLAVRKKVYIGDRLIISDNSTSINHVSGEGVNFRSLSRNVSTTSNNDAMVNTFEGTNFISGTSTISNASTVYITGPPTISGGGIISNPYSFYVNSGISYFGGRINGQNNTPSTSNSTGSITTVGGISSSLQLNAIDHTNGGSVTLRGGLAVGLDTFTGGKLDISGANATFNHTTGQGTNFRSRIRTITTTGTDNFMVNTFEGTTINTSSNIDSAATLFITRAPVLTGSGVLTNSYSLWVNDGISRFDNKIIVTNGATDSINTMGGIKSTLVTDSTSHTSNSSGTFSGGISVAKKVFTGLGFFSSPSSSIASHLTLKNTGTTEWSLDTVNSSGDFTISRYDNSGILIDKTLEITRSTGVFQFYGTTASSSVTTSQNIFNGGISINNTTNATSYSNGGTLSSGGGFAFNKDGYINGALYVNGVSNLNQVSINTTNGEFSVTGSNRLNFNVTNASSILSQNSMTIESSGNITNIKGNQGVNLTSATGSLSVTTETNSSITVNNGSLSLDTIGLTIDSGVGNITIQNTGIINIDTNDLTNGIKLGTVHSGVPVTIGTLASTTVFPGGIVVGGDVYISGSTTTINSTVITTKDVAVVVNNKPTGISDGGLLIRRFQQPNDISSGQVIGDTPRETGAFQTGNASPGTLVLASGASSIDNYYKGWWIKITSGTAINSCRRIRSYNGTTKVALIFDTINTNANEDGLNLTFVPVSGDTYNLYDIPYAGFYYSEINNEIRVAGIPFDQDSGVLGTPTSYLNLHVNNLVLEGAFIVNGVNSIGNNTFFHTSNEAILVGKTNGTRNTFIVDTLNDKISVENGSNTINSSTGLYFKHTDLNSTVIDYGHIKSIISSNTNGAVSGTLNLGTVSLGTLADYIILDGDTKNVDFTSNVSSVRILGTVSSNNSVASLLVTGGITSLNTTDAISVTSGGSATLNGGLSVAKKIFAGSSFVLVDTNSIGNSNSLLGTTANINTNGDILLYNSTKQTIAFSANGSGVPSFTTRSLGTKLLLNPTISGSNVDYALGISSNSLWLSGANTTSSIDFYLGTNKYVNITSTGLSLQNDNTGITFSNGSTESSIKVSGTSLVVKMDNKLSVKDTSNNEKMSVNSSGLLNLGLSNSSGVLLGNTGSIFNVSSNVFTDTTSTGTVSNFIASNIKQTTLAATSLSVTTTDAITFKVEGAPIQGTNETITNAYAMYIDTGNSLGTNTINNVYGLYIKDSSTGASVTNKYSIYVDGSSQNYFNSYSTFASSNRITSNSVTSLGASINTNGDISLYGSSGTVVFGNGSGVPVVTTRSTGTKLLLKPNISGSSVDGALGISSTSLWYSVPTASWSHDFYLGPVKRVSINDTGMEVTSSSSNFNIKSFNDTTGIKLSGSNSNNTSSIELYGSSHSGTPGLLRTTSDTLNINVGSQTFNIDNNGNVSISSAVDATPSVNGSFSTIGGAKIKKSLYVGTSLVLDFNQTYSFTGDTSGNLNMTSGSTTVPSNFNLFSFDGNNTVSNGISIYGKGTVSSFVNTEFLSLKYNSGNTSYILSTNKTGTGSSRALVLETSGNSNQIKLNTNGTVEIITGTLTTQAVIVSSTTNVTNSTTAALIVQGGQYIDKDLLVNGNVTLSGTFSAGVSNPTVTISTIVNSGAITVRNPKISVNSGLVSFSVIFQGTPVSTGTKTSFEFTVPGVTTNFANLYDITFSGMGYYDDSTDIIDISNVRVYPIIGSTKAKVVFTSGTTSSTVHTINIMARYIIN